MLRFKILVSVVPLLAAAILARVEFLPGKRPCVPVGQSSLQIASAPWHADLHVSFTNDPAAATVRVALTDSAEAADFAVVDDVDGAEDSVCEVQPATRFVAVTATSSRSGRPGGLPHLRALEAVYRARSRGLDRRCPRRASASCRRVALKNWINPSLTLFSSRGMK
jgi:hypothetical protein